MNITNVCMYTQQGKTALFIACTKGRGAFVKLLLQKHADVSISKKVGQCISDFHLLTST